MRQWQAATAAVGLAVAAVACQGNGTPAGRHSPAATASPTRSAPSTPWAQPTAATSFPGVPTVGPLFPRGAYPALHTCTASVVRSPAGDVIMTAAHCITGSAAGYRFAPGYRNGQTPYGVWRVRGAYGDQRWLDRRDPHHDWAFLSVARKRVAGHWRRLQDVTGANALGTTAAAGRRVTVIGYAFGANDEP